MSAQDGVERALRDLYVFLSKCRLYENDKNLIIVNKKELIDLLGGLNNSIYGIMEAYELTTQSRNKAERAAKKAGEEIIHDASLKAEDVYAASVLYSDEALKRVQDIMSEAVQSVQEILNKTADELSKEKQIVHDNQSELRSCLSEMQDTKKYLNLIEERNKQLLKEKQKSDEEKDEEASLYAAVKPEIKINEAYFREHGLLTEDEETEPEEEKQAVTPEINVNLDSEYFKWKEREASGGEEEEKEEKRSFFGKIKR